MEQIQISDSELITMQGDDELISQFAELNEKKKDITKALELMKKELLSRIEDTGENLTTDEYTIIKTTRKGSRMFNKDKFQELVKELDINEDNFYEIGKSSTGIRLVKNKSITF